MMKTYQFAYLLSLSYDGSNYHGWVKQPTQKFTIQQALEKSLTTFIKTTDFYLLGASKTDAGVHALDQKVLLKTHFEINNLGAFKTGLNKVLPNDLYLNEIEIVSLDFQVRQVKQKVYEYDLNLGNYDVFQQRYQSQINQSSVDLAQLQTILNLFVGTHDFFLFSGLSEKEKDQFQTNRAIDAIEVKQVGSTVKLTFKAVGFLRYQIRMIVGSALTCLLNPKKLTIQQIEEKLTGIGQKAPYLAPSNGLFLKKVIY